MAKMIPHFWDHLGWLYSLTSILAISTALMRPRRPKQYCLQVNPSSVLVLSPIRDVKRIIAFFCSFKKEACENPGLYRIRTLYLFNTQVQ